MRDPAPSAQAVAPDTLQRIAVGLCLLLGVTIVLLHAVVDKGSPVAASGTYPLHAKFTAIDGLQPGNPVVLAGVPVGVVTDLSVSPEDRRVTVGLSLHGIAPPPQDSTLRILSHGLFGGKYVRIEPGTYTEALRPGDFFDYTQDSVVLEDILTQIVALAK